MKPKSNSGAKKRFRTTGSGKIVGKKSSRGHLLLQKSTRQKKLANIPKGVSKGHEKKLRKLLPHI